MKQIHSLEEMVGHEVVAVCNNRDEQYVITLTNDTYISIGICYTCGNYELDTFGDIGNSDFSQKDLLRLGIITQEAIDLKEAQEKAAKEQALKARETYEFEQYAALHLKFTGKRVVR